MNRCGQNPPGITFCSSLGRILGSLQTPFPGNGFYDPGCGKITSEFKQALRKHKLRAFWGEDASPQPGNLQEVHLHETAVSWVRHRLTRTTPKSVCKCAGYASIRRVILQAPL